MRICRSWRQNGLSCPHASARVLTSGPVVYRPHLKPPPGSSVMRSMGMSSHASFGGSGRGTVAASDGRQADQLAPHRCTVACVAVQRRRHAVAPHSPARVCSPRCPRSLLSFGSLAPPGPRTGQAAFSWTGARRAARSALAAAAGKLAVGAGIVHPEAVIPPDVWACGQTLFHADGRGGASNSASSAAVNLPANRAHRIRVAKA